MRAFQRHSDKELASLCAAAVPSLETNAGDISEADLLREDLAYMHAKDSGALDRNRDDRALSLQINRPDAQEREARRNGHG
jgi:hypothetical protein